MSHHIEWDDGETLTIRPSDKVDYIFFMDREPMGKPRIKVRRYDRLTRDSKWIATYNAAHDDDASIVLRQVVRKHTGIDYGCDDDG